MVFMLGVLFLFRKERLNCFVSNSETTYVTQNSGYHGNKSGGSLNHSFRGHYSILVYGTRVLHLATPTTTQTDLRFLFSVIPNQLYVIFSFSKYSQPASPFCLCPLTALPLMSLCCMLHCCYSQLWLQPR